MERITSFKPGQIPPQVMIPQRTCLGSKKILFLAPASSKEGIGSFCFLNVSIKLELAGSKTLSESSMNRLRRPSRGVSSVDSPSLSTRSSSSSGISIDNFFKGLSCRKCILELLTKASAVSGQGQAIPRGVPCMSPPARAWGFWAMNTVSCDVPVSEISVTELPSDPLERVSYDRLSA